MVSIQPWLLIEEFGIMFWVKEVVKKTRPMKKIILGGCLISLFLLPACNSSTQSGTKDSIDSAQKINDSSGKKTDSVSANISQPPVDNMTTDFAIKAASGVMIEVELGKIAQEKAVNQRVKNFGAMMVQDHT